MDLSIGDSGNSQADDIEKVDSLRLFAITNSTAGVVLEIERTIAVLRTGLHNSRHVEHPDSRAVATDLGAVSVNLIKEATLGTEYASLHRLYGMGMPSRSFKTSSLLKSRKRVFWKLRAAQSISYSTLAPRFERDVQRVSDPGRIAAQPVLWATLLGMIAELTKLRSAVRNTAILAGCPPPLFSIGMNKNPNLASGSPK